MYEEKVYRGARRERASPVLHVVRAVPRIFSALLRCVNAAMIAEDELSMSEAIADVLTFHHYIAGAV